MLEWYKYKGSVHLFYEDKIEYVENKRIFLVLPYMIPRKNVGYYVKEVFDLKYQNDFGKSVRIKEDRSKFLLLDFKKNVVLLGTNVNIVV